MGYTIQYTSVRGKSLDGQTKHDTQILTIILFRLLSKIKIKISK